MTMPDAGSPSLAPRGPGDAARARHRSAEVGGDLDRLQRFFDRIYVVSIERNVARREALQRDLEGVSLTYIPGIDGHALSEAELREHYDDELARRTYGRSLSPGQIGCALSHRAIYRDVVERGLERVLILEDDAVPCVENLSATGAILAQLPADWNLLYLYAIRSSETRALDAKVRFLYPLLSRVMPHRYDMRRIRRNYSRPYSRNLRVAGQHWSAVAYAVTRSTAMRMLEYQTPIRTVADDVTRMICAADGLKAFLSIPTLFRQRPGMDSTIWNRPPRNHLAR